MIEGVPPTRNQNKQREPQPSRAANRNAQDPGPVSETAQFSHTANAAAPLCRIMHTRCRRIAADQVFPFPALPVLPFRFRFHLGSRSLGRTARTNNHHGRPLTGRCSFPPSSSSTAAGPPRPSLFSLLPPPQPLSPLASASLNLPSPSSSSSSSSSSES